MVHCVNVPLCSGVTITTVELLAANYLNSTLVQAVLVCKYLHKLVSTENQFCIHTFTVPVMGTGQ